MRARAPSIVLLVGLVAAMPSGACDDSEIITPKRCGPPVRTAASALGLAPAFGGQTFKQPIEIALGPEGRLYVLEQRGVVRVFDPRSNAPATTALDISANIVSGGEAGLLGIAFDPSFATNRFVYLHYDAPLPATRSGVVFQSVIARYESRDGGATIDPTTEKRLLVVDQPFSNHNGGKIAFGPDGFLYIGLGDGGSGGDPQRNGQNRDVLLGKILRIDPNRGEPYAIPEANPFARGGGRPEIFAYGLRNPWKFSFDTETGDLWCADVGQNKYEEVNRIVPGGNYGWNVREGKHCFGAATCPTEGFVDPVAEYGRSEGVSITGGYVYRGKKVPDLVGKFVYGDFGSGRIWAVDAGGAVRLLVDASASKISSFAQDAEGEIYVADYATGAVKQLLTASESAVAGGIGATLGQTGCLDPSAPSTPPAGAIRYTVNAPLWSDGAEKDRWIYVPSDRKITVGPDGDFDVPPGSVAVKTFTVGKTRVETRLLVRYEDATWAGYSYEWNDEQTDAVLLTGAKKKALADGSTWYFPSRAECFACHTAVAGFTLGLETRQLDRVVDGKNQLDRFAERLASPVLPPGLRPLVALDRQDASDDERVRSYLHSNCSMCHREGAGAGGAQIDLRIDKSFAATRTCNVAPQTGDLGVSGARIVAPGDPARSTLLLRMRTLEQGRMPNLATSVVDVAGTAAVERWIGALPSTCP
ncbi:MAG: PQQ-dependent sugar dehydrogenase [Deltaproteobacteria bacterium]|nr:PQQ-dependent sugar dehydrogenase [Deltaproteobacteria bacterium]